MNRGLYFAGRRSVVAICQPDPAIGQMESPGFYLCDKFTPQTYSDEDRAAAARDDGLHPGDILP